MTVALVTRGMIRSCCQQDQIISYYAPTTQEVLEVRPRVRSAAAPPAVAVTAPQMTSTQELKPETKGADAPVMVQPDSPQPTSAQELKPVVTKVEEE